MKEVTKILKNIISQFTMFLLMLILSTAFDFASNNITYFNESYSVYDIMNINMGTNALNLFNDKTLVGFNEQTKRKNLSGLLYNYNDYAFIVELCIFLIFSGIFSVLIYQVNKIELEYIRALIRFNSIQFEQYLSILNNVKKKLLGENPEEEVKNEEDGNNNEGEIVNVN